MPASPLSARTENVDLLFPRLALLDVEVVGVRRSQAAEDLVRPSRKELVDRRPIVSRSAL